MRLEELDDVIAVHLDRLEFKTDWRMVEQWGLLYFCGPLTKLAEPGFPSQPVKGHEIVSLSHPSVRDYLVSRGSRDRSLTQFPVTEACANALIAKICLVYLLHFSSSTDSRFPGEATDYPLLEYAAKEWPGHYRKLVGLPQQQELDQLACRLISETKAFNIWLQLAGLAEHSLPPNTLLYYMSLMGISGVVSKLLTEALHPDDLPTGSYGTALGAACYGGYEDVAQLLLAKGARLETETSRGMTPLHLAARQGRVRLVSMLIDHAPSDDVNLSNYVNCIDIERFTPLHLAAGAGNEQVVKLLLDNGADAFARNMERLTPLDVALREGREAVVQLLVYNGFDVDVSNGIDGTRLMKAARTGDERAVRILLSVGADPNLIREPKPWPRKEPGTPLQGAIVCGNGQENIVKMLLKAGADPNLSGWRSGNALHWAAAAGNENIVQSLLDAGADVHFARVEDVVEDVVEDGEDEYPLNIAVGANHPEIVRLLLAKGAHPDKGVIRLRTPLDHAIDSGFTKVEEILREFGARKHREPANNDQNT